MPDFVDVGNDKAFAIAQGQLLRQTAISNTYIIAHCSGDGDELTTVNFSGTKNERFAFMRELGIDPVVTSNWAFAQWSHNEQLWVLAAGDGEMKQRLKQHFADRKLRTR